MPNLQKNSTGPVLMGGLQRSGTSLLRSVLATHPDLAIFPNDLPFWTLIYRMRRGQPMSTHREIEEVLEEILGHVKMDQAIQNHLLPDSTRSSLRDLFAKLEGMTLPEFFQTILEWYAKLAGKPRWGLKTPHNEFFADHILSAYRDARFIHVLRDPRDAGASVKSLGWNTWGQLRHPRLWAASLAVGERNQRLYPDRYKIVRFEDFIADPPKVARELCDFLDLDYRDDLISSMDRSGTSQPFSSFGDLGNSRGSVSIKPVGRYESVLTPLELWCCQSLIARPMQRWGYEQVPVRLNVLERLQTLKRRYRWTLHKEPVHPPAGPIRPEEADFIRLAD